MTNDGRRTRRDFFEPLPGWQVWRRTAKREISRGRLVEAAAATRASSDADAEEAPDFFEPVVGWRFWRVVRCDGRYYLSSLFNNIAWAPLMPLDAHCLAYVYSPRHRSPAASCHCGVYASRRDGLDWQLVGRRALGPLVLGTVSLWGSVIEAQLGWRAEHGYPERLYVPTIGTGLRDRDHAIAADLHEYGVPVQNVLVEHAGALMPAIDLLHDGAAAAA